MFGITREMLFGFLVRALVLFTAMPVHECAHGLVATMLGDDTPRAQGRLTLNPFAHLDWAGSMLLFFTGFGWAKPVEVDMRNFKSPRLGMAATTLAGPLSNFFMALFVAVVLKLVPVFTLEAGRALDLLLQILRTVLYINISLAVFNFLPVPPLDGSKILWIILPSRLYYLMLRRQRGIYAALILLLFFGLLDLPLSRLTLRALGVINDITSPIELLWKS